MKIKKHGGWNKGKKGVYSEKTLEKMRNAAKGRRPISAGWCKGKHMFHSGSFKKGSEHPNWKGGKTELRNQIENSFKYKHWRSDIFQRDNWTCQTCQIRGGKELHPHHIKRLAMILKENNIKTLEKALNCKELWNLDNGITLCCDCHKLTGSYGRPNKKDIVCKDCKKDK